MLELRPSEFKKLQDLPYFEDIIGLLKKDNPEDVASWIQEVKGGRKDIKRDSLIRQLYRLQKRIPVGQLEKLDKPKHVQDRLDQYAGEVNELVMLTKLWYIQMERIEIGYNVERRTNFLSKGMYREVEQAKDILVKIGELKIKLGHYEGAATDRFAVSGQVGVVDQIKQYSETERERLGNIFDRYMRAAVETGRDLRQLPPGEVIEGEWDEENDPLPTGSEPVGGVERSEAQSD